jgi:hypothetical protein
MLAASALWKAQRMKIAAMLVKAAANPNERALCQRAELDASRFPLLSAIWEQLFIHESDEFIAAVPTRCRSVYLPKSESGTLLKSNLIF